MMVVSARAYLGRTCVLCNEATNELEGISCLSIFDHGMLLFPDFLYQMGDELIMASLYLLDYLGLSLHVNCHTPHYP
jgi:hypothetical protein